MDIRKVSLWISETFVATLLGFCFCVVQFLIYCIAKFLFFISPWFAWPVHIINGFLILGIILLVGNGLIVRRLHYRSRWHDGLLLAWILFFMYLFWLS